MTEKTGTELMMQNFAGTRLDALVAPLMRLADQYAGYCVDAEREYPEGAWVRASETRKALDAALREAFTEIVKTLTNPPPR